MEDLRIIITLLSSLNVLILGGIASLWYKLGKVETRIQDHLQLHRRFRDRREDRYDDQ